MSNLYYKFEININGAKKGSISVKATSSQTAEEVAMEIIKTAYKCETNATIILNLILIEEKQ